MEKEESLTFHRRTSLKEHGDQERIKEKRWLERIEKRPINLMWTGKELAEQMKVWEKEDKRKEYKERIMSYIMQYLMIIRKRLWIKA